MLHWMVLRNGVEDLPLYSGRVILGEHRWPFSTPLSNHMSLSSSIAAFMSSCMQNQWKVSWWNKSGWTRDDSDREHMFLTDVLCIAGPSRCGATEVWGGRALRSYSGASGGVWEQGRLPIGHRRGLYWGVVWLPARPGPLCKWHRCQLTTTSELCLRWDLFFRIYPHNNFNQANFSYI